MYWLIKMTYRNNVLLEILKNATHLIFMGGRRPGFEPEFHIVTIYSLSLSSFNNNNNNNNNNANHDNDERKYCIFNSSK